MVSMSKFKKFLQTATTLTAAAAMVLTPLPAHAATVREAQWFLDAVHAPGAQNISRGNGVKVCVLDSGVDATHPDLAGAVLPGKSFGESASADARSDSKGHGTAMAGLIAARGGGDNNALGIAPGASILPVAGPASDYASIADAIKYCVDNGAKVLNFSGGRPGAIAQDEKDAIAYAIDHDVVVVTAMGNKGQISEPNGFALLPGVIAVTGTMQSDASWPDSWTNDSAVLSAPAITVSTFPKSKFSSGFGNGFGTSDSAAIVSGTAALVRAKFPNLNAANVINRLIKSSTDLGEPGRDATFGYGLVNSELALTMDIAEVAKNPLGEEAEASPTVEKTYSPAEVDGILGSTAGIVAATFIIMVVAIWFIMKRNKNRLMPQAPVSYNLPEAMRPTFQQPPTPQAPPAPTYNQPPQQPFTPPPASNPPAASQPPQDPRFPGN